MPGTQLEPHGCPLLQSPAVLLLSHSPTHSGLRPPPKERPGDTEDHIRDKRRGLGRGNRKNGRTEEKKKKKSPKPCQIPETNGRSAPRQKGQRRWPGRVCGGGHSEMAGQTEPAASGGRGRPAGCGGGSAAAPGPLSRPLRASSHTSPPPAPSVRSREYPPPPSPHLLLPRRPLAPRGRSLRPGGSPGPGPTTGRGWMGHPEPGMRREGSGA